MLIAVRTGLVAIGCWLAVAAALPLAARAEQPAPAAATDVDQKAADMPGCPGKANGGACCASCQEQHAADSAKAAAPAAGGCPCQRAKQAAPAAEGK